MRLSPRQMFALGLLIFIAIGLAIGVVAAWFKQHSPVLMIIFFAWVAIGSVALMQIRCPRCGTPIAYQGKLGRLSLYAGFARRHCQNCGEDLTKRANRFDMR